MLYSRFVESRLFLSSLTAMNRFCELSAHSDFGDERWPLQTAYVAAYTCSRTFDRRPLDNLARFAGRIQVSGGSSLVGWDAFCLDYIMVAARLDDPRCLKQYFDFQLRHGMIAAVRAASLAYFLGDLRLLIASTERIAASDEHEFVWEKDNALAMISLLRGNEPDLPRLCHSLRGTPETLQRYCALDMYLLMREMQPGLRLRPV
ncbi:hypothetical protein IT575_10040 [bacterium]|nr:hypothetical protein [bacterium]